jgi:hypothetical protein
VLKNAAGVFKLEVSVFLMAYFVSIGYNIAFFGIKLQAKNGLFF